MTDVLILLLAGVVGALLNTDAYGESAVVLPILIMIAVEPGVANASSRPPIVVGWPLDFCSRSGGVCELPASERHAVVAAALQPSCR